MNAPAKTLTLVSDPTTFKYDWAETFCGFVDLRGFIRCHTWCRERAIARKKRNECILIENRCEAV